MQNIKSYSLGLISLAIVSSLFLFSNENFGIQKDDAKIDSSIVKNDFLENDTTKVKSIQNEILKEKTIKGKAETVSLIPRPKRLDELSDSLKKIEEELIVLKKDEPRAPKKITKHWHRFDIYFDPKEHPKLAGYEELLFEIDESKYVFNDSVFRDNYVDISMLRGSGIDDYIVTAFKINSFVRLPAYPVFEDKAYGNAMKVFEKKFAYYQTKLQAMLLRKEGWQTEYNKVLKEWKRELAKIHKKVKRNGREL